MKGRALIRTGEMVELASPGARLLARVIDIVIMSVPLVVLLVGLVNWDAYFGLGGPLRLTCVWLDVASAGGFNPHVRVLGMGGCDGRRCVVGGLGRGRRVGRLGWCVLRCGVLGRG